MAESTYHIELANDESGVFTPTCRRGGTPAASGVALTIPWVENNHAGSSTTSKDIKTAFEAALAACADDFPTDASFDYSITLTNNGSGVYTPVAQREATPSSGGSALTIPWVENNNSGSSTTTKSIARAARAAFAAIANDRAAGN